MKRRLPYSRTFDPCGNVQLFIGTTEGWRIARRDADAGATNVLLLPAGDAPQEYRWPEMIGRAVYTYDDRHQADDTEDIARFLITLGATEVLWIRPDQDILYVRDVEVAA